MKFCMVIKTLRPRLVIKILYGVIPRNHFSRVYQLNCQCWHVDGLSSLNVPKIECDTGWEDDIKSRFSSQELVPLLNLRLPDAIFKTIFVTHAYKRRFHFIHILKSMCKIVNSRIKWEKNLLQCTSRPIQCLQPSIFHT